MSEGEPGAPPNPWGQLAIQVLPGLVIGLAVAGFQGQQSGSVEVAKNMQEMAIQLAKQAETIAMVCKMQEKLEASNRELKQQNERLNMEVNKLWQAVGNRP
jgi:hypothetical protein